jgi:hypothetical protein
MEDPDELIAFLDNVLAQGVDGIVLFHAAYTAGENRFSVRAMAHRSPVAIVELVGP